VAAGRARDDGTGEVFLQVGVDRLGNVRVLVLAPAVTGVGERKAAVDDHPVGIVEVGEHFFGGHKRGEGHIGVIGVAGVSIRDSLVPEPREKFR